MSKSPAAAKNAGHATETTIHDVVSSLNNLTAKHANVLVQDLCKIRAPGEFPSDEDLKSKIQDLRQMELLAEILHLALKRTRELHDNGLDEYSSMDFRCASHYRTLSAQDAEYQKKMNELKGQLILPAHEPLASLAEGGGDRGPAKRPRT